MSDTPLAELRDLVEAALNDWHDWPKAGGLDAADRVVAALVERLGGVCHHLISDEAGWRLQHPLVCRLEYEMLDCPTNHFVMEAARTRQTILVQAEGGPRAGKDGYRALKLPELRGRWVVELVPSQQRLELRRVEQ